MNIIRKLWENGKFVTNLRIQGLMISMQLMISMINDRGFKD